MSTPERKLKLEEILEQEIAMYTLENSLSRQAFEANSRYEEAERRYEEAERRYEEAERRYEEAERRYEEANWNFTLISESRIWRYSKYYRRLSALIKSFLPRFGSENK